MVKKSVCPIQAFARNTSALLLQFRGGNVPVYRKLRHLVNLWSMWAYLCAKLYVADIALEKIRHPRARPVINSILNRIDRASLVQCIYNSRYYPFLDDGSIVDAILCARV